MLFPFYRKTACLHACRSWASCTCQVGRPAIFITLLLKPGDVMSLCVLLPAVQAKIYGHLETKAVRHGACSMHELALQLCKPAQRQKSLECWSTMAGLLLVVQSGCVTRPSFVSVWMAGLMVIGSWGGCCKRHAELSLDKAQSCRKRAVCGNLPQ